MATTASDATSQATNYLTDERMKIVEATAPAVAGAVNEITPVFYRMMLGSHPELFAFFNKTNQREGKQPKALANSVLAAVGHLKNLGAIQGALDIIVHKHCALGVLPEHYQIVHDNFLAATAEVLGDAVTPAVADAWSGVLMHLATGLIGMEAKAYDDAAARPGGWNGVKDFTVTRVEGDKHARSIYMRAADGSRAPAYEPGQFITVCNNPTSEAHFAPRHYTLSRPGPGDDDSLRITVRCHDATADVPAGLMSTFLHSVKVGDTLQLRPPFGVFTRNEEALDTKQLSEVYLTAGIGITTAAALVPAAVQAGKTVAHVHVDHSDASHPLKAEMADAGAAMSRAVYDTAHGFDVTAHFDELRDAGIEPVQGAFYMLCGPGEWMQRVQSQLAQAGVDRSRVQWENFGPRMAASS